MTCFGSSQREGEMAAPFGLGERDDHRVVADRIGRRRAELIAPQNAGRLVVDLVGAAHDVRALAWPRDELEVDEDAVSEPPSIGHRLEASAPPNRRSAGGLACRSGSRDRGSTGERSWRPKAPATPARGTAPGARSTCDSSRSPCRCRCATTCLPPREARAPWWRHIRCGRRRASGQRTGMTRKAPLVVMIK